MLAHPASNTVIAVRAAVEKHSKSRWMFIWCEISCRLISNSATSVAAHPFFFAVFPGHALQRIGDDLCRLAFLLGRDDHGWIRRRIKPAPLWDDSFRPR